MATAIMTIAEVKDWMGVPTITAHDDLLTDLVLSASEKIESMIGRIVKQTTVTDEVHSGEYISSLTEDGRFYKIASTELKLRNFPILSVSVIKFDDEEQILSEDNGFYLTDEDVLRNGTLVYTPGWPVGYRNIKVTYSAGWSTVPYKIQQACKKLVAFEFDQSMSSGNTGVSQMARGILIKSSGDGSLGSAGSPAYRTLGEIMDAIARDLEEYTLPGWAKR